MDVGVARSSCAPGAAVGPGMRRGDSVGS